jgi:hypothetical protein
MGQSVLGSTSSAEGRMTLIEKRVLDLGTPAEHSVVVSDEPITAGTDGQHQGMGACSA